MSIVRLAEASNQVNLIYVVGVRAQPPVCMLARAKSGGEFVETLEGWSL